MLSSSIEYCRLNNILKWNAYERQLAITSSRAYEVGFGVVLFKDALGIPISEYEFADIFNLPGNTSKELAGNFTFEVVSVEVANRGFLHTPRKQYSRL